MAFMDWDVALSVGVAQIDDQHKVLVDMVNTLHEAMKVGQARQALGSLLDGLVQYTVQHFSTEEQLCAAWAYPGTLEHKRQHKEFVEKVAAFKAKFDGGIAAISLEIMSFLSDWLVKHIKGSDKKLGAFLNQKDVT